MQVHYDVIIIGSGPTGLAASIYTNRARLTTLLFEKETLGGQVTDVEWVENYPGFPDGVFGAELQSQMMKQAKKYGLQLKLAEVKSIELQGNYKLVKAGEANYLAKAVIITGGAQPKKLGISGESEFVGKGVIYCAVCDGGRFAKQEVAVAGGGDAGITEALYLANLASKVTLIELMPQLTASKILQERALANPKIEIVCGTKIEAIIGDAQVKALKLLKVSTDERTALEVEGILVRIGLEPNTGYLKGLLSLDSEGYILVNEEMETSIPGIFAAGDIRHASARQIATAVGDGVTAALSAQRLIAVKY